MLFGNFPFVVQAGNSINNIQVVFKV